MTTVSPTYDELLQRCQLLQRNVATIEQELEQERDARHREEQRASQACLELAQERQARQKTERRATTIMDYIRNITSNKMEEYAQRITDIAMFLLDPDAVLEGRDVPLNVAYMRGITGLGHDAMASYLKAKADSGGIEYDCQWNKETGRNESRVKFVPSTFFQTNLKACQASVKQREGAKKRQEKHLKKLICPACGDSDNQGVGMVHICGKCGYRAAGIDPEMIFMAKDVLIVEDVEDDAVPDTPTVEQVAVPPQDTTPSDQEPPDDDAYVYGDNDVDDDYSPPDDETHMEAVHSSPPQAHIPVLTIPDCPRCGHNDHVSPYFDGDYQCKHCRLLIPGKDKRNGQ